MTYWADAFRMVILYGKLCYDSWPTGLMFLEWLYYMVSSATILEFLKTLFGLNILPTELLKCSVGFHIFQISPMHPPQIDYDKDGYIHIVNMVITSTKLQYYPLGTLKLLILKEVVYNILGYLFNINTCLFFYYQKTYICY